MSDLEARIAEVLAYQHCRMTNSKADHPIFGYHAFSEDQREYLRSVMMPAAEAVTAMLAPVIAEAKVEALREAARSLLDDPSAAPATVKWNYNRIYAGWILERADNLETL